MAMGFKMAFGSVPANIPRKTERAFESEVKGRLIQKPLALQGKIPLQKIRVGEDGEDERHPLKIFPVVEHEHVIESILPGGEIVVVDLDQLSAGVGVLTGDSQKAFHGFLP